MGSRPLISLLLLLGVTEGVLSSVYSRSSNLVGQSFLDAFTWQTIADPNYGRVNYIDEATAQSKGLFSVSKNQVTLRADSTTTLSSTGPGRDAFRLSSNDQYTAHVAIFDIVHMPQGCGTWPAVWYYSLSLSRVQHPLISLQELGANWPDEGEIDIVEGVNNQSPNLSSMHTSANCTMPSSRSMTGTSQGTNCDVDETNNSGCGVLTNDTRSFGPAFNSAGGGWYAIERTSSFVKIFFWERHSMSVPTDVTNPGSTINTENWGVPAAYFPDTDCNFATHLGPHNIMIDLDFCGAWAGDSQVYASSGCPSTCIDYVNQNPSAFRSAYFTFNSLNIYE
ncbi:glycoside hydrolase family 16 protein [Hydnomerulius pinastri MD-312]|uniref:Glycoside hydrolase family 16 protein n=1 Tax=Hydnomerulius pinastri MD-312 TaxID=994086 RepID=A0A0C9WE11_9AGAM|nr:glycoside hydrolase family 16 protein [Hydnomerulius pinastri MD-312]